MMDKKSVVFWCRKNIVSPIKSTYLCIRFPFLYPRNIFSGRHYTNWNLEDKQTGIYKKWSKWSESNQKLYYEKFGPDAINLMGEKVDVYTDLVLERSYVYTEYIMKLAGIKERFLYWWYGFCEDVLGIFHCIPTYSEYDAIPEGWRKRFGIQFCKELKKAILQSGGWKYMRSFRIEQIKEKFGQFQCYVNNYTKEVNRVIKKYEYISKFVCVNCGKDAVKKTLGWICPYCDDCLPQYERWIWIDPIYGWSSPEKKKYNEKELSKLQ